MSLLINSNFSSYTGLILTVRYTNPDYKKLDQDGRGEFAKLVEDINNLFNSFCENSSQPPDSTGNN